MSSPLSARRRLAATALAGALAVGPGNRMHARGGRSGIAGDRGGTADRAGRQQDGAPRGSSPRPRSRPLRKTTPAPAPKATSPLQDAGAASGLVAVVGVTDGDTIKVRLGGTTERIRVIGIDTPELASHDCYAQQAASKMQSLVQSKQVKLVADPTQDNRDRYGRLLRHVRLADGRSVAEMLIAGGFGREYTYDRAYAGQAAHLRAQSAAKSAHRGIWSSGCVARLLRHLAERSGTVAAGGCSDVVPDQGQHRQRRREDLPRARRCLLRGDEDQRVQG